MSDSGNAACCLRIVLFEKPVNPLIPLIAWAANLNSLVDSQDTKNSDGTEQNNSILMKLGLFISVFVIMCRNLKISDILPET